jgi:hypothetical protein
MIHSPSRAVRRLSESQLSALKNRSHPPRAAVWLRAAGADQLVTQAGRVKDQNVRDARLSPEHVNCNHV